MINEEDSVCDLKRRDKQTVLHSGLVFYFINEQEFSGKEKIMT